MSRTRYLIQIKSANITADCLPPNLSNVFFTHNCAHILVSTTRFDHLEHMAAYAQNLKYVLKTKKHVVIDEFNFIELIDDPTDVWASNHGDLFSMFLIRPKERMKSAEEVISAIYDYEIFAPIYTGLRTHVGCIPFVSRRECGNLYQVANEMQTVIDEYRRSSGGVSLTPYLGKIVYSSKYEYKRKK